MPRSADPLVDELRRRGTARQTALVTSVPDRDDEFRDTPLPATTRLTKSSSGAVTALGAAMIAVGEIIEPQNTSVEVEQTADAASDDSGLDLSFGELPPLDEL